MKKEKKNTPTNMPRVLSLSRFSSLIPPHRSTRKTCGIYQTCKGEKEMGPTNTTAKILTVSLMFFNYLLILLFCFMSLSIYLHMLFNATSMIKH